jgi:hypothetical protein
MLVIGNTTSRCGTKRSTSGPIPTAATTCRHSERREHDHGFLAHDPAVRQQMEVVQQQAGADRVDPDVGQ